MIEKDDNEVVIMWLEHFEALNQLETNDKYLIKNSFFINITIIFLTNYEKFHDKMNKSLLTRLELKKQISINHHSWIECWDSREVNKLSSHKKSDHRIDLQSDAIFSIKKTYEMSREQITMIKKYIDDMMSKSFIRRNHARYVASIFIVKKSNEDLLVCVDYRALNALIVKNKNASSLIRDTLTRLCSIKIYMKFDIIAIFNEIRVRESDQKKLIFIIQYDLYEYVMILFELYNASKIFQSFINEILREHLNVFCIVYIDDILIYNNNYEKHQTHVHQILDKLRKANIYLNIKKCHFNVIEIKYLELIIIIEDIKMNLEKVEAIKIWQTSRYLKNVQTFLDFVNFYRRFILDYFKIVKSLIALIKMNNKDIMFSWVSNDLEAKAFQQLKNVFIKKSILRHFDSDKKIWIKTNAFDYVVVVILFQKNKNDILHSIVYMFKQMSLAKCNYEIYDKELLIIIRVFEEWHFECVDISMKELIKIINDHQNLQIFMITKQLNRRQARWVEFLSKFNFQIVYRSSAQDVKSNNLTKRSQNLSKSNIDERRQF